MAFIGLSVPPSVGDLFGQVTVPGTKEPKDFMHITMIHLGKDVPIERIGEAAIVAYGVCSQFPPFQVKSELVTSFQPGKDGVPIIAKIESPELHRLHGALMSALDRAAIDYSKKWPEFKPHVTLAYSDEGTDMPDQSVAPIVWTVNEVVLWAGDEGARRMVVKFPLEMRLKAASGARDAMALRVAARHQAAKPNRADQLAAEKWEKGGRSKFVAWAKGTFLPAFEKDLTAGGGFAEELFGEGVFDDFHRLLADSPELKDFSKHFGYPTAGTPDDTLIGMWGQTIGSLRMRHPDRRGRVTTPTHMYEKDYTVLKGLVDTLATSKTACGPEKCSKCDGNCSCKAGLEGQLPALGPHDA